MSENVVSDLLQSTSACERVFRSESDDYLVHFNSFFGFKENPFNNTPDPSFFYLSQHHHEALLSMLFGVKQRRGFIVVTGEIGSGKTTICREFLFQLSNDIKLAIVLNPKVSATHLLASVTQDFGIKVRGKTKRDYYDAIHKFLLDGLQTNQNACLIIDEAQCLDVRLMEEIRLLSNMETSKQKLLQIILMGQPELKDVLSQPCLAQLKQRIGVYVHLRGLNLQETEGYIQHRLNYVGGGQSRVWFTPEVMRRIHEATRGIPRLINTLSDRVLMAAFARQTHEVSLGVAECAFEELAFVLN